MDDTKQITITCIREIYAIYFALLQCGYDYYSIERSRNHNGRIQSFIGTEDVPPFFYGIKQDTCEVYPYWPRAAILETASFYLSADHSRFHARNLDGIALDEIGEKRFLSVTQHAIMVLETGGAAWRQKR